MTKRDDLILNLVFLKSDYMSF